MDTAGFKESWAHHAWRWVSGTNRPIRVEQGLWLAAIALSQAYSAPKVSAQPFEASPYASLVTTATLVAFTAAGVRLLNDPRQRGNGRLLLLAAAINAVVFVPGEPANGSWWPIISAAHNSSIVLVGWFLLRYPDSHVRGRLARSVLIAAAVWFPAVWFASELVPRPWQPTPLGTAVDFEQRFDATALDVWLRLREHTYGPVTQLVALGFSAVLVRRLRHSPRYLRRVLLPVLVPGILLGVFFVLQPWLAAPPSLSQTDWNLRAIAMSMVLLVLCAGVLISSVQRRLAPAVVGDLLAVLGQRDINVRDALRHTLDDPQLEVYFWIGDLPEGPASDTASAYVDLYGQRTSPTTAPGRIQVPVTTREGAPLAIVDVDQAVESSPTLLRAVTRASALALENERLHAELLAHIAEVRASRTRIIAAGVAERRAVERDLHDGVQQRLLALSTTLARLNASVPSVNDQSLIQQARLELRETLGELRDLARGIHPAILTQIGLRAALESVAERLPVNVTVRVPDVHLPEVLETTIYYLVCEALTNVVKHSGATHAEVVVEDLGPVTVRVRDNGTGVQDPQRLMRGSLADRVRGLGGDLRIETSSHDPGAATPRLRGTLVEAVLPIGSDIQATSDEDRVRPHDTRPHAD